MIEQIGEHMPGGFFIYLAGEGERLLYANRAVWQIFGCETLEEFKQHTGYTFRGMIHPDDYAQVSSSIVEQIEGSKNDLDYVEYRIIRKDGEVRWLDDLGMNSEWVLSGKGAVDRVRQRHAQGRDFYAVIVDWKMPDLDGVETTRAIHRIVREEVPIIIISAYDWTDIEQEARAAGANAFIGKPLDLRDLAEALQRWIPVNTMGGNGYGK